MIRDLLGFLAPTTRGGGVALFRIAFGLLGAWTAAGALLNAQRYYGPDGMVPWALLDGVGHASWSLFALAPDSRLLPVVVGVGFLLAALCLAAGVAPRAAALVVFVCAASLHHRNPYVANSGDRLFVILAGLSVAMPLGHRVRLLGPWRDAGALAPGWSVRLGQLQIAYVYSFSALAKLGHERWRAGLALQDVLASPLYAEWPTSVGTPVVQLITWGTLAFELGFPLLVWFRRFRPWCLAVGVAFHLGIDVAMTVPMFSAVMLASYALFLDDDVVERAIARLETRRGETTAAQSLRGTESIESTPTSAAP